MTNSKRHHSIIATHIIISSTHVTSYHVSIQHTAYTAILQHNPRLRSISSSRTHTHTDAHIYTYTCLACISLSRLDSGTTHSHPQLHSYIQARAALIPNRDLVIQLHIFTDFSVLFGFLFRVQFFCVECKDCILWCFSGLCWLYVLIKFVECIGSRQ